MAIADFWDPQFWTAFAKQGLGAVAAAGIGFLYARVRQTRRRRHFRRVFGRGVEKAEDIVLSVPLWYARGENREQLRFDKKRGERVEESLYGPDEMYNRQDMFAAAHVLNVLNSHLEKEVTYSNDADSNDTKPLTWGQQTVILIGSPAANLHVRDYMLRHPPETESGSYPYFVLEQETAATGARTHLRDPRTGETYRADAKSDYGLILRVPNAFSEGSRHFVFMVAGVHEWSTREAGRFFNLHWRELGRRSFAQTCKRWMQPWRWKDEPSPCGFIFKMNSGRDGLGTSSKVFTF